jgi:flagellar motor switch protein FliG
MGAPAVSAEDEGVHASAILLLALGEVCAAEVFMFLYRKLVVLVFFVM